MATLALLLSAVFAFSDAAGPSFLAPVQKGQIHTSSIYDPSGLAASHIHDGIFYTHNDHGGSNHIYAVDPNTGESKARFTITGAANADWESIAVGPCIGGGSCIYIGDVGSSAGTALNTIYKVREPAIIEDKAVDILQKLHFTWNEEQSECIMVAPSGDLFVVSMVDGGGNMGKIPATAWGHTDYNIASVTPINVHSTHHDPLGCDMSADGKEMLMLGKENIFYWPVTNGDAIAALSNTPQHVPFHQKILTEAIAWTQNGDGYYTIAQHHNEHFYYIARQGTNVQTTNPPNTPKFADGKIAGLIKQFDLVGVSGLAASRDHAGIYYVHNDNGDTNKIYAIDPTTGEVKATYTILGATNNDWEDIAVGPCPGGGNCIYIGDTGDATGTPKNIIYRVKEPPAIQDGSLPLLDQLHVSWNAPDSECLMVDPAGNSYLISREIGGGKIVEVPATAWGGGTYTEGAGQPLSLHTHNHDPMGCDISADGTSMLIKAKDDVYYYKISGNDVMGAVKTPPAILPYHHEDQGEAIAWTPSADGYYTVGEGHFLPFYFYKKQ